jgi:hypothetical protein
MLNLLDLVNKITSALEIGIIQQEFASFIPLEHICPQLETSQPVLSFEPANLSKKAYFEYVHLSAIKIIIDFKTTKKEVNLQIDPRKGFGAV